jgi:hypothetical protein
MAEFRGRIPVKGDVSFVFHSAFEHGTTEWIMDYENAVMEITDNLSQGVRPTDDAWSKKSWCKVEKLHVDI